MSTEAPAATPSPQLVGKAFVEQYYFLFHHSPENVHKFYLDSSTLSRPDSSGVMTSVTTMEGINDLVLSLDCNNYITEISTADSQPSYKDGVFILVTGFLIKKEDGSRRRFTQSFFLAPQGKEGAFFVLNDVFRFLEENQLSEITNLDAVEVSDDTPKAPLTAQHDMTEEPQLPDSNTPESEVENVLCNPSENGECAVVEEAAVAPASLEKTNVESAIVEEAAVAPALLESENVQCSILEKAPLAPASMQRANDASQRADQVASVAKEDVPKKSYASIVKVMKGNAPPVYIPATKTKPSPSKAQRPSCPAPTTAPAPARTQAQAPAPAPVPESTPAPAQTPQSDVSTANSKNTPESNGSSDEGYSVYIKNLPMNTSSMSVEEEFKRFGTIRPGGVQVRNHKVDRFCFGFIEFESRSSMQAAIKGSPCSIGGRPIFVEEKMSTTKVRNGVVTNGRGGEHYPSGRGGYRNESFRGRGGYGGNQGYGGGMGGEFRNREYQNNRGEYVNRGRGFAGRDGYQPRYQNGNGRAANGPNSVKPVAISV